MCFKKLFLEREKQNSLDLFYFFFFYPKKNEIGKT
jgi:hypothetical protein